MGCFCCGNLNPEVKALNDCYPPPKDLLKAGPEYQPLSQDLSKLTYHATNKPSSLAKIGDDLERRVVKEARASTGGYPKSRAALLISLRILHKLLTECKRDIGLFARQALRIISTALDVKVYQKGTPDLEVVARAASCFVAFATYTDGAAIGVDDALTNTYLTVLQQFAGLATARAGPSTGGVASANGSVSGSAPALSEKPVATTGPVDVEEQSRTRLIGLSALSGAACSDAVFSSSVEFPRQVRIIVPALLALLKEASVEDLKAVTARNAGADANVAPFFKELSARRPGPVVDRRAPSIHEHVPGEKGPDAQDVTAAAYRCLYELVSECQLTQAGRVLDVVIEFLDANGWEDTARCCWLAERLTGGMLLQSRFVVPTRLVELLVAMPDTSPPSHKQFSIVAMVTTVLRSNVSLVGLAVTDLLAALLSLIVRRAGVSASDALLPPLVDCVSSLGVHIYYADQINDIVEEIGGQIAAIPPSAPGRADVLLVLIACIVGVLEAVDVGDEAERERERRSPSPSPHSAPKPLPPPSQSQAQAPTTPAALELESPGVDVKVSGRRNAVSPEVWQDTLHLLCEASPAVRSAYTRALLLWLETELPADRRPRPDDAPTMRFCNALHAAAYTLALSSSLGPGEAVQSVRPTPSSTRPATPPAEGDKNGTLTAQQAQQAASQIAQIHSMSASPPPSSPPGATRRTRRRVSLPVNTLRPDGADAGVNGSAAEGAVEGVVAAAGPAAVATPADYASLQRVLGVVCASVPSAALLTGAPMLAALDAGAGELGGAHAAERARLARELVCVQWARLGRVFDVPLAVSASSAGLELLGPALIPPYPSDNAEYAPSPPVQAGCWLDEGALLADAAQSPTAQAGTGLDAPQLAQALNAPWSVERALRNSTERLAPTAPAPRQPAVAELMSIPNHSYHSLAPGPRPVDVTDLRDALGSGSGSVRLKGVSVVAGAAGASPHSSRPSTLHGAPPAPPSGSERKKGAPDAREVLNDIFSQKKRSRVVSQHPPEAVQASALATAPPAAAA